MRVFPQLVVAVCLLVKTTLAQPWLLSTQISNGLQGLTAAWPWPWKDSNEQWWTDAYALGSTITRKYAELLINGAAFATDQVYVYKEQMDDLISSARGFGEALGHPEDRQRMLDELNVEWEKALEKFKEQFPPTDEAPSHEQRQEMAAHMLDLAEDALVKVARNFDIEDGKMREIFQPVKHGVHAFVVTAGDIAEQHPALVEMVIVTAAFMLIPQGWFLRPLLSLFGFGPAGPVKGSAAAWCQSRFFGAVVTKGSWFAHLQRAGMLRVVPVIPALCISMFMLCRR